MFAGPCPQAITASSMSCISIDLPASGCRSALYRVHTASQQRFAPLTSAGGGAVGVGLGGGAGVAAVAGAAVMAVVTVVAMATTVVVSSFAADRAAGGTPTAFASAGGDKFDRHRDRITRSSAPGNRCAFSFGGSLSDRNALACLHESSLRGAKATKQSSALLAAIWIASLRSHRRGLNGADSSAA